MPMFARDIGIDLGTASVLVYVKGKGIVIREPSVVAIEKNTGKMIKVGKAAQQMLGRTPANIEAIRPLRDGVISQYDVTLKMIQYFIKKACDGFVFKPRVMICIPSEITEVEERAVIDAATAAGARQAHLIEEPVAAAIGAGINIAAPSGNMIIDIGGGTTDIAVISLNDVVVSKSIRVAGDKFDAAIVKYVRERYNMVIGDRTAEAVKCKIGAVYTHKDAQYMDVKGRNLNTGLPGMITLSSKEMLTALFDPLNDILEAVCSVIERTPAELVADILNNGIVMTGGGSLLWGLDRIIEDITHIPTRIAKDPISCVALGTGKSLDNIAVLPDGALNLSRRQQKY